MENEEADELYMDMQLILSEVQRKSKLVEHIELTLDALTHYQRWYKKRTESTDVYRRTFEAREDDHILRVAGLLSINDGLWEIHLSHIKQAIKLVSAAKESGASIFTGDGGMSMVAAIGRLRGILLQANTPLTQAFIYKHWIYGGIRVDDTQVIS